MPPPPARGSPRRPAQEDRILRAPAFAVILRLKLAGDSLSRVSSSPCEAARHALRVRRRRLATGRVEELEALNRRAAKRESSKGVLEPICAGTASAGRGLTRRRVSGGRIFVGLRKFEAKQDAVFAVPERDPSLRRRRPAITDQRLSKRTEEALSRRAAKSAFESFANPFPSSFSSKPRGN